MARMAIVGIPGGNVTGTSSISERKSGSTAPLQREVPVTFTLGRPLAPL